MSLTTGKKIISEVGVQKLNNKYKALSVEKRIEELYNDFEVNEVMLTSSFASTSALLLNLFSRANKEQTVFF